MDYALHIIIEITNWIPICLGYSLLFGRGKVLHFGPMGLSLAVGYGIFLTLMATGSYALGVLMGTLIALLLSCVFAWLSFRLKPDGLGVITIAAHLAIISIVLNWTSVTRGALGIVRIPRLGIIETLPSFALLSTLVALFWIGVFLWAQKSAIGRQLSALAEHEWHAAALGINRKTVHLIAFILLGLAITSDNFFFAQYTHLLHPADYQFPSFIILMMLVVAGKPGTVWGVLLSTILILLLKESLRFLDVPIAILGPMRLLLFGIILFVAVWVRRDTLFPQKRTV
jgi:branched-chain amino acid transport system permease protein